MSSSIASATSVNRVFNFNAGPSALPLPVLERIREELLDWRGSGMSVMEMSHRSPEFESISAAAEAGLRQHLAIPDDYAVAAMFAVGRPGNPEDMNPELRAREKPSPRKPVQEIICEGRFAFQ